MEKVTVLCPETREGPGGAIPERIGQDPGEGGRPTVSRDRVFLPAWCHAALVIALAGVSLVPVWTPERFPSQNGPWFLLSAHMFKEYGNPQWDYSENYVRNWHPIPHMLHDALTGVVSVVVPILVAEKIVLSVYVILLPASVFYLFSVVAPRCTYLAYFSFLMIFSYPLLRGYHDFTLSIPLFFFTLGYWLRHRNDFRPARVCLLALMTTLVYLSHLFAFLLLAGVVGWVELFERHSLTRACASCLLLTWPGWLLCADYARLNCASTWVDSSDTSWLPFHWTVENFVRQYFYSVSLAAYAIAVVPWLCLTSVVLYKLAASSVKTKQTVKSLAKNPLATLLVFLMVAYLVLPYKFLGWHKVNVRLVPFILILALAWFGQVLRNGVGRRVEAAILGTVVVAAVCISGLMTRQLASMDKVLREYVSGVEGFAPNSRLLPIHLENPTFGQIRPLTRAHEYYHLEKGGANGSGVGAYNTVAMMWYRTHPVERTFPKYEAQAPERSVRRIATTYDYVLVWGTDPELADRLTRHGFVCVYENNRLTLYRNRQSAEKAITGV